MSNEEQEVKKEEAKDELAEERKNALELNLSLDGVLALQHLLSSTETKGRTEMRAHSKLFRELKKKAQVVVDEKTDTRRWEKTRKDEPVVVIDDSVADYLKGILVKKIDAGIPGGASDGYDELFDLVEEYSSSKKKKKD